MVGRGLDAASFLTRIVVDGEYQNLRMVRKARLMPFGHSRLAARNSQISEGAQCN